MKILVAGRNGQAAYTAVDKAEKEESLAQRINAEAPGVMAVELKKIGSLLVHYSTDYVFDGDSSEPYTEEDTPNPINAYGRSKLEGETAIQQSGVDHLIFRTTWVYAARGNNFLLTMLRLLKERDEIGIVADQQGTPNWARLISDATALCLQQTIQERAENRFKSGLYNLTSSGNTTWYGFAYEIAKILSEVNGNLSKCMVNPIDTSGYPTLASRPKNSTLNLEKIERMFGVKMPPWNVALKFCMQEISNRLH
jgi:dTDP-4-dehydrorhamnose reductase